MRGPFQLKSIRDVTGYRNEWPSVPRLHFITGTATTHDNRYDVLKGAQLAEPLSQ